MSLLINDRHRYIEKIKETGVGGPSKWTNDPTQWLQVSHPDIYNDLTESPGNELLTHFLTLTLYLAVVVVCTMWHYCSLTAQQSFNKLVPAAVTGCS